MTQPARIFGHDPAMNVYSRAEMLVKNGFVGAAANAFRQAWYGDQASRLIVIRYESLARHPASVMARVYQLLEEDAFKHDYGAINYSEPEFDQYLGMPGMHRGRPRVEYCERQTLLPPDLFRMHDQPFWDNPAENRREVTLL